MTETMLGPFGAAGPPAHAANGAPLRWTPGPDERRLPSCEEEPVPQNTRQLVAVVDCFDSLRLRWRERPDVFVGSDQFVHWDPAYDWRTNPANPPQAPDVYVAFGVANRHRNSYVVWEEGKPPDFVLEVVSPSSRRRDEEAKPGIYAKMGVLEFCRYDPDGEPESALTGLALGAGRGGTGEHRPLPRERLAGGAIGVRSAVLGLLLCVRPPGSAPLDGSLCWYDPETGGFLPTRHELADGKRQAEARADASEARADASEARADASEARADASEARANASEARANASEARADVSEARADASEAKADASEARADASEARAEASEARAQASEAKVAELEALIEKLRRETP